jgi:hypothetical protein
VTEVLSEAGTPADRASRTTDLALLDAWWRAANCCRRHTREHGEDAPDEADWQWPG